MLVRNEGKGLRSNGCFMTSAALTGSDYRVDIISCVGYSMSDLVVLLVLCTVVYNIRSIDVVLQVPQDNTNPTGNE
jgi:hypothetical protein